MAYKKYIERNGKLYGPYLYESKRVDGKVVSEYHGRNNKVSILPSTGNYRHNKNKRLFRFLIPLAIITLLLIFIIPKLSPTGKVTMELQGDYVEGQILSGLLNIKLNQGELLPADSKLIIENNGQTYEFFINKLTNAQLELGNFYVQGKDISGEGEGYGVAGSQIQAERVYFKLKSTTDTAEPEVLAEETPTENQTPVTENPVANETAPIENIPSSPETNTTTEETPVANESLVNEVQSATEIPVEQTVEIPTQPAVVEPTTEEAPAEIVSETPTESAQIEPAVETSVEPETTITGNIIRGIVGGVSKFFLSLSPTGNVISSTEEIPKDLTYPEELTYTLKEGEKLELVSGSVATENQKLEDSYIKLEQTGNKVTITTSYYTSTEGFGADYLKDQIVSFPIDLTNLNLSLQKGTLDVRLVYGEIEIDSTSMKLEENATIGVIEKPIAEENVSLTPEQNATVPEETKLQKLTTVEKETLLTHFGNTTIKQEAKDYRDWVIVKFTLGTYQVEYSYQNSLNSTTMDYYIERDKINWLKDIAYTLQESSSNSVPLVNYSKSENLF